MNDTSPRDQAALLLNAKKAAESTPRLGEEVWRLRDTTGRRAVVRATRPLPEAGAGWDVMLLENGEPLFSRRCAVELPGFRETLSERFVSRFELLRADAAEMTVAAR